MFKKLIKLITKNQGEENDNEEVIAEDIKEGKNTEDTIENIEDPKAIEEVAENIEQIKVFEEMAENIEEVKVMEEASENREKIEVNEKNELINNINKVEEKEYTNSENIDEVALDIDNEEYIEEDEYIKDIKIKRGKSIKAIDVYTQEEQIFKNYKECSKKLKLPLDYIKENLKYGYTDYFGQAIKYLSKELKYSQVEQGTDYLEFNKTPMELFNILNNRIFTSKISEIKRDEILCSPKIEPIKMHYVFECVDSEYDDYFNKYKSIIKRGGKKKIELVDKKGEAIEIFKSLDECANYLEKEKNEVVDMLKHGETKVGRYEIRYSLRSI